MLQLDDPLTIAGLTLFRDHVAAGTFHYLPGGPELVREDGRIGLRLVRYRGGEAGALLTLTVELSPGGPALAAARTTLAERHGTEVNLVPVLFTEGTVRLLALGVDSARAEEAGEGPPVARLVEQVLATATPSLLGRQRAVFSLRLAPRGATLVAESLRTGAVPLLIVYQLTFWGLRLARGLRARIDFRMAYEHLRSRFAPAGLVFQADLDHEAEALEQAGHVRIEDVDYAGSAPADLARRRELVTATLREITETLFFRPSASPLTIGPESLAGQPALREAWAAGGHSRAAFVIRDLEQVDEQELAYDLTVTAVAERRVAPQGALRLPAGPDAAGLVADVELEEAPPFEEVRVLAAPESDWTGVDALQFDIRAGEAIETIVISRDRSEGSASLPSGELSARWRVLTRDDPDALGRPPEAETDFRPLRSRHLIVDPAALAGRRLLRVALGDVDLAEVRRIDARLVRDGDTRRFALDGALQEVAIPLWGREPLTLTATMHLARGGTTTIERAVGPLDPIVLVHQPPALFRLVAVELVDPLDRYAAAFVELEGLDGRGRRLIELGPGRAGGRWSVLRDEGDEGRYRYRVRRLLRDARVEEDGWTETADSLLLVGDPEIGVRSIEGVLLGVAGAQGALIRITSLAPVQGLPSSAEVFLGPGESRFRVRLGFRRGTERGYRVEGQVFLPSRVVLIDPREDDAEVVVVTVAGG